MPIVIWGSRSITSTKETGRFYCPHCQAEQEFALKQVRPFFTLYFIPLFPVGGARRYVQCKVCAQTYKEAVLDFEAPSQGNQLLARAYDQLKRGMSTQVVEQILVNQGMTAAEAQEVLDKMCEGRPRHCSCGQSFHPEVRKCNQCGGTL